MKTRQGCSGSRIRAILCLLGIFFSGISPLVSAAANLDANDTTAPVCKASEDYLLAQAEHARAAHAVAFDFSCLTNIPTISPNLSSYQLIDTRKGGEVNAVLSDAWQISVSQLKMKTFLKKRPLLLIGESFSRAQAAADCAVLKTSGFEDVKILVGGIDTWLLAKRKSKSPVDTAIKTASAQEVLHDYFNNKVILIATSKAVAQKLDELGLDNHEIGSAATAEKITHLVITHSGDGFYPVVIVTDEHPADFKTKSPLPNLYKLAGGVDSLADQIYKNFLTNHARSAIPARFVCGNS